MELVPGIITAAVDTGHWRLSGFHTSMMRLGVAFGQELTLERDHSSDGTMEQLLRHDP